MCDFMQLGWRPEDEWMDEYRDADNRGTGQHDAASVRPGMAPEEEALIQVSVLHSNMPYATSTRWP